MSNIPFDIPPELLPATENPLTKYYRVPGLNVHLPTKGAYMPANYIEFDMDGTIPIFPMRAEDEYLLKNADSLLSGHALQKLLESCVPAIKKTSLVSAPDLDVLLLAIRAATFGEEMEVQAKCPKCGHDNAFNCNLPAVLGTLRELPPENPVRLSNDLVACVRPYNFQNATQLNLVTYQETRKVQAVELSMDATEDDKVAQMNASMDIISKLQSAILGSCVIKIITPDGEVTNPLHIAEFMRNIRSTWVTAISKKLSELNENYGIDKTVKAVCQKTGCGEEWTTNIEFDPSSFFGNGS